MKGSAVFITAFSSGFHSYISPPSIDTIVLYTQFLINDFTIHLLHIVLIIVSVSQRVHVEGDIWQNLRILGAIIMFLNTLNPRHLKFGKYI